MRSPTQRVLRPADVEALVDASFGTGVAECAVLAGGGFAAVWRVRLSDGRQVVLKVAPAPGVRLLRYEQGLVPAEAEYFRLVRARTAGVPVPEVLYLGTDPRVFDSAWLFTGYLPGTALANLAAHDAAHGDDSGVRRELGAAVARLHTVTGPRFGYTGARPHGSTWAAAFTAMVDALLADARVWDVELPCSPGRIQRLVAGHADVLDLVAEPRLVHFDLWDGNVLASAGHLTGLVDGERYLYGDPLVDLVSPGLFRRMEYAPDHPFLLGYAEATGRPVTLDASARLRLTLYRMHLSLLMLVELPSRGMAGDTRRRDFLARYLTEQLDEL